METLVLGMVAWRRLAFGDYGSHSSICHVVRSGVDSD